MDIVYAPNKQVSDSNGCYGIGVPVPSVSARDWVAQLLMFCPPNVETLLHIEGDAVCHLLKVPAKLAQDIAGTGVFLKH